MQASVFLQRPRLLAKHIKYVGFQQEILGDYLNFIITVFVLNLQVGACGKK